MSLAVSEFFRVDFHNVQANEGENRVRTTCPVGECIGVSLVFFIPALVQR
jgi:hypothetical protein